MFTNLIESKPVKVRSRAGAVFSMLSHAAIIATLVVVTANAGQNGADKTKQEDVKFAEVKKEVEKKPPPPDVAAPPPPKGFQVLAAPINIPDKIPDVDLSAAATDEADFSGKGQQGGTSKGVAPPTDQPLFEFQVEKQVLPREGNTPPRYPAILQSAQVEGEVLVQFVVDTSGRVETSSFKVLKTTNELFVQEVKRVLPFWKFYPAEAGGRRVKQFVQQQFVFTPQPK